VCDPACARARKVSDKAGRLKSTQVRARAMLPAFQRSVGLVARRILPGSIKQAPNFAARQHALRSFSVLSNTDRFAAFRTSAATTPRAASAASPLVASLAANQREVSGAASAAISSSPAPAAAAVEGVIESARSGSMVFEVGLSFVFLHYQSIFIGVMRCLFQSFRPLLILFVFGQILKAVFFVAGAPIWLSFYSIWLFEVIYGLAQCAISFIFISFFYNNLSLARLRPALSYLIRQQHDKLTRVAKMMKA